MVTLTDEPCALSAVTNLPMRATWAERGKTFEGCFSISGTSVVAFFEDKTVVVMPLRVFARLVGA